MGFFLGIDGGGTNLKAMIGNQYKETISFYKGGPANYHSVGQEKVKESFIDMFNYFNNECSITINNIKTICMGCAGVNNKADEAMYAEIIRSLGYNGRLLIYNDAFVALVGANGEPKGAVLISGTGSIAYGIGKDGSHVRVGGWGHIIGDEGSAYAIGRDALTGIAHCLDGIITYTKLKDAVMDRLDIKTSEELMSFVYDPETKKQDIAELAPIVLETAIIDKAAENIVKNAAHELCIMIYALRNKMNMENFKLALSGSILVKSDVISSLVIKELKSNSPDIHVYYGKNDPAYGALTIAWKEAASD